MGGQSSNNKLNSITSVQENVKITFITKTIGFIRLLLIRITSFVYFKVITSNLLNLSSLYLSPMPMRHRWRHFHEKEQNCCRPQNLWFWTNIHFSEKCYYECFKWADANYSPQLGFCIPSRQRDVELLLGTFTRDFSKHF